MRGYNFACISFLCLLLCLMVSAEYLFRLPVSHQIDNIIDLLAPIHIRFATDGVKHRPVVRFPIIDLIYRGQILNQPGIYHLIHGPGIPW